MIAVSLDHLLFWNVVCALVLNLPARRLRGHGWVKPSRLFGYVVLVYILARLSQATVSQVPMETLRGGGVPQEAPREEHEPAELAFEVYFRETRDAAIRVRNLSFVRRLCSQRKLKIQIDDRNGPDMRIDELHFHFRMNRLKRNLFLAEYLHNGHLIHGDVPKILRIRIPVLELIPLLHRDRNGDFVEHYDPESRIHRWELKNGRQFVFADDDELAWSVASRLEEIGDPEKEEIFEVQDHTGEVIAEADLRELAELYETIRMSVWDIPFDTGDRDWVPLDVWRMKQLEFREPQISLVDDIKWFLATVPMIENLVAALDPDRQ